MSFTVVICADHGFVNGGQAKVAIESALGLKAAGLRVVFFAAVGPLDERLAEAGVETLCLSQHDILTNPSRKAAALQGMWNKPAETALVKLLARMPEKNTLVHVHGWAKALSPSIAAAIRASGFPAVYTMHEYFLHCPNGGFYDYRADRICPLQPLSTACWAQNCDSRSYGIKLWRNARLLVAKKLAKLENVFSDMILISDLQQEKLAPHMARGARTHRVCNPIAIDPLGHKADPGAGDLLFVGRLSPEKGAHLFAEAARRIGVNPVFVGDGPLLEPLAARYPQGWFMGWRSPAETRMLMRAARAVVFPSLWYEGQPLTVLEAKALGTPVVVSDACAGREEIEHGVSGLWFNSGNPAALAQMLAAVSDERLTAQLSSGAYDSYWANPPTLQRHVAETVRVYERALGRG